MEQSHISRFTIEENVDLAEVVRMCPPNITGADFYGICSTAWLSAVRKLVESIGKGKKSSGLTKYYFPMWNIVQ